jgi:hypothetical protein
LTIRARRSALDQKINARSDLRLAILAENPQFSQRHEGNTHVVPSLEDRRQFYCEANSRLTILIKTCQSERKARGNQQLVINSPRLWFCVGCGFHAS